MKNLKESKYIIISVISMIVIVISCVKDGDFLLPDASVKTVHTKPTTSITTIQTTVQQQFNTSKNVTYTFPTHPTDTLAIVEGYVISIDATGNFYKKIVVQDKTENPTAGIEILLNKSSLSEEFDFGRKIFINLDGLTITYDDGGNNGNSSVNDDINPTNLVPGKFILGSLYKNSVGNIPAPLIENHVWRSEIVATIIPTSIKLDEIQDKHINTFVKLPNAQVVKSDMNKTFASEPYDEFDGNRTLLECVSEETVELQTSTFASFKSNYLPTGKGEISAVLSKDYRAEFLVLILNSPSKMEFYDANRCEPVVLDCGVLASKGEKIVFEEGFEKITTTARLSTVYGWKNINVNEGDLTYSLKKSSGKRHVEISAYNSDESPVEVWLISPEIDLDSSINEVLTFETKTGYDNGKALSVYVSTDFVEDVKKATWTKLDAVLSEGLGSGYNRFKNSGDLNISCLSGKIHLGFRYKGADGGVTTTFQINDIKIVGE